MADPRINLYHNLAVLLEAGVPIGRALKTAHKRGRIGRLFGHIADDVSKATSLAEAVERRKRHFEPLDVSLIRVGEDAGELGAVFEMLGQWYSFRHRIHRTILSGLILPIMLIHFAAVLIPVPQLALGGWDVAAYVQAVLIFLAAFYIPACVVGGIIYLTPRRGPLRVVLDTIVMGIPVLSSAVRDLALSRYCNVFGMTLKAGVPIVQAAAMAADAAQNAVIRRALAGGTRAVQQGNEMSTGFSRRLLPADFIAVWEVGEETGNLDESALRLGGIYAENAERGFEAVAVWVPRLVYFIICGAMAYFVVKGFMSIYGNLGGFMAL